MSKFYSLFSSSKGNAAFIGSPSGGVLIDVGVSCRRLLQALKAQEISPEAVQAVYITHTHMDHVAGLQVFLKRHPVPVYGTAETLAGLQEMGCLPAETTLREVLPGRTIHTPMADMTAFSTMHDAVGSCGYRLELPDGQICAVCTDLGCVTKEVQSGVAGADLVLLEANYDLKMLRNGPYPYVLQQRISGKYGHLCNTQSAELAEYLVAHGTTRLILGHLSEKNNTMAHAERTVLTHLQAQGMYRNRDFLFEIAAPDGLKQAVIF